MKKLTGFMCCLALAGLMLCAGAGSAKAEDLPTLKLVDLLQEVSSHQGKVVMLNFFASWCPPCKREIPSLITIREDLSEDDFVIIGLSTDEDPAAMMEYVNSVDFNYPLFRAAEEVSYAFGIDAIPFNVIYDRDGRIAFADSGLIPEGRLRTFLQRLLDRESKSAN